MSVYSTLIPASRERRLLTRLSDGVSGACVNNDSTLKPVTGRDAVLARLGARDDEIPVREQNAILDAFRHDGDVHRAFIARKSLPEEISGRLARLVGNKADLEALLCRHAVPRGSTGDLRFARPTPGWWRQELLR